MSYDDRRAPELKNTFLFGYSKVSVHKVLSNQRREYEERIRHLEEINGDFKRTIERYQEKELFISEALTEAKRISRDILVDSELKAEELVRLTQEDLSERIKNTERKLKEVEDTRRTILDHEEFMKVELRQLLTRQMDMIDKIELSELHNKGEEVERLLGDSQDAIDLTRKIASGSQESETASDDKIISFEQKTGEIPVFSFDGLDVS